jgi:phosphatidylglycerophosphatase A
VGLYAAVVLTGLDFVYIPLLTVIILAGVWAASRVEGVYGHDSPRIVIDEVAGQMVALTVVERSGAREVGVGMVLAFLLFRFFDILKPFPIRRLEHLPGGIGVVADDLGAGVYALVVLMLVELGMSGFAADFWNQ